MAALYSKKMGGITNLMDVENSQSGELNNILLDFCLKRFDSERTIVYNGIDQRRSTLSHIALLC